jgi:hypothetical protein
LVDDPTFRDASTPVQSQWLSRAHTLGSSWVRIGVYWRAVAPWNPTSAFQASDPSDPQYNWATIDRAVRSAVAHGQRVMLMAFSAPNWAQGPGAPSSSAVGPGSWEPNPVAFAAFGHALAVRYSGHYRGLPQVSYFQAWNEPNLAYYLAPEWAQTAQGTVVPVGPILYRELLNSFYAAVKKVQPHSHVFAAGLAPFGDLPSRGTSRMQPVTFLTGLFCLNSALKRGACTGGVPHLDGLDQHNYSPWYYHANSAADIGMPDLGRIWRILHAAQRAHTVLPAGSKPLWMTEVGWQSTPPNSARLTSQAHFLDLDFYTLWTEHVSNVFWFLIQDPITTPGDFTANGGLFFRSGAPKPAAAAYVFPFVVVPSAQHRVIIWGKAPRRGTVVIQRLIGGRWRRFVALRTTGAGIFYDRAVLLGTPPMRAVIGRSVSPVWVPGTS